MALHKNKKQKQKRKNAAALGAALAGGGYGTADSSRDSMSTPKNMTPGMDNTNNHNEEMLRRLILRRAQNKKRRLEYTDEAPSTPIAKSTATPEPTRYGTPPHK